MSVVALAGDDWDGIFVCLFVAVVDPDSVRNFSDFFLNSFPTKYHWLITCTIYA